MKYFLLIILASFVSLSCSEPFMSDPILPAKDVPHAISEDIPAVISPEEYRLQCHRTEYYFCPGVTGPLYRIKIVKDICVDPPEVLSISECEEFLECDPSNFNMGEEPCTADNGLPGTKKIYCDKGHIKEGKCETDCTEEVCDGIDNDCDDEIDEGQLNACGECGIEDPETCDGIDNDCNGLTDEDLIQQCSTICETGYELCINGSWGGCTAKQPSSEICDGVDNDCDGDIDEGLDCLCTLQDVGVLFPCEEDPLLCGTGYKTCECKDDDCNELALSPCFAMCAWQKPVDSNCDPLLGLALPYELCNNHDDNCNQLIDEDLYKDCYTGPPNTLNVGICEGGMFVCEKGKWGNYNKDGYFVLNYCQGETTPSNKDTCNGVDEDCDGLIDDGNQMQDTDVLFVIDWSASMNEEITAVLMALSEFSKNYSDEEVVRWGILTGPKVPNGFYGNLNHLERTCDLSPFEDFMDAFSSLNLNTMNGQFEMLYDAVYLALLDLSISEPWKLEELTWTTMAGSAIGESAPPLEDFKISWRPNANRVIIVFSDEPGQSFMIPKDILGQSWNSNKDGVTQKILLNMIQTAPDTSIYTFSTELTKNSITFGVGGTGWEPLATESGGKWFELTFNPTSMYNSLMEIIDKEVCGE